MATILNPLQKLGAARQLACRLQPYFTGCIYSFVIKVMPGLGTLAATDSWVLLVDWDFIGKLTVAQLAGIILHEVQHPLREHGARFTALASSDHKTWNVAADYEINDDQAKITPELFQKTTPDYCRGIQPSDKGFPEGLLAEDYFQRLKEQAEQARTEPRGGEGEKGEEKKEDEKEAGNEGGEGEGEQEKDEGNPSADSGEGGEGEGGEGEKEEGKGQGHGNDQGTNADAEGLTGKPGGGGCGSCAHGRDSEEIKQAVGNDGRSALDSARIRQEAARQVQEAAKTQGNVPGGLARWADAALTPPKVRWQDKLRAVVRRAVRYGKGPGRRDYKRLSRRQWGVGLGAGKPIIASRRQPLPRVAVVADTSGSMGDKEMSICLREAAGILKDTKGEVIFVACDAAVHSNKVVARWQDIIPLMVGGGGTSFAPAFSELEKLPPSQRPDVVIYATDGFGDAPAQPTWCKTIWLLVGKETKRPCDWGDFIEIGGE